MLLGLDGRCRHGGRVNEGNDWLGNGGAQDRLGVVDEHDVCGYWGDEIWLFADGLAKGQGVAVLEGDRDIGYHRARHDIFPSTEVRAMMGMQVDDVDLCM